MPTVRVATFNVENLFARFKFKTNEDADEAVRDGWRSDQTKFSVASEGAWSVPASPGGAELPQRGYQHECRWVLVVARLPSNASVRRFWRGSEVFHDATAAAAAIDRIVHHATILETKGKSFRLQAAEDALHRSETGET